MFQTFSCLSCWITRLFLLHFSYRAVTKGPILSRPCIQPLCFTGTSFTFCRDLNCSLIFVHFAMGIKFCRTVLHRNYEWKRVGCCCSENSLETIQNMPYLYRLLVSSATCFRQNALVTDEWPLPVFDLLQPSFMCAVLLLQFFVKYDNKQNQLARHLTKVIYSSIL